MKKFSPCQTEGKDFQKVGQMVKWVILQIYADPSPSAPILAIMSVRHSEISSNVG